jgi:hypothetical protein
VKSIFACSCPCLITRKYVSLSPPVSVLLPPSQVPAADHCPSLTTFETRGRSVEGEVISWGVTHPGNVRGTVLIAGFCGLFSHPFIPPPNHRAPVVGNPAPWFWYSQFPCHPCMDPTRRRNMQGFLSSTPRFYMALALSRSPFSILCFLGSPDTASAFGHCQPIVPVPALLASVAATIH